MWTKTSDGSVVDRSGKVIYFSTQRFVADICHGDCCFICGAGRSDKTFTDEHVLPKWLLRRYNLFDRSITLSNDATYRYDRFTVPCCSDCNALLGREIEAPISEALAKGGEAFANFIANNGMRVYTWLGLIFLKTHLKDRDFRYHLDAREGEERIADLHVWEELHHLHCVVRCFYTGCTIDDDAASSFLAHSMRQDSSRELFDFSDLSAAQTLFIRLEELALFAVFDDAGAAMHFFWQRLARITGPISELQAREVMAELAFLNLLLKERPKFATEHNLMAETARIRVFKPPEWDLDDRDMNLRGQLMTAAFAYARGKISTPGAGPEEVQRRIATGQLSFLFDDDGQFINRSRVARNDAES